MRKSAMYITQKSTRRRVTNNLTNNIHYYVDKDKSYASIYMEKPMLN